MELLHARTEQGEDVLVTAESVASALSATDLLVVLYNYLLHNGGTTPIVSGIQVGRLVANASDAVTADLLLDFMVGLVDTIGHLASSKYAKSLVQEVNKLWHQGS